MRKNKNHCKYWSTTKTLWSINPYYFKRKAGFHLSNSLSNPKTYSLTRKAQHLLGSFVLKISYCTAHPRDGCDGP